MNTTIFPLGKTIQDIVYYDMPDPGTDQDFNALAELAAFSCNCPVAIISFTPIQKQWIHTKEISLSGLTPIHDVFYTTALCQGEVMVITDVANDERFAVTPSAANYSGIHFYAGTPVISTSGNLLGSVFVLDTEARAEFSSEHKAVLKSIAQLALRLLELNVANRLVVKQAGEMLEEEKKMTRLVISEQEAEKGFIAHKLQENFAQTLAASKMYLEFAEHSVDAKDHFIHKGMENISGVIDEIRYLCNTMVPSTLGNANPVEFLEDMVAEWETKNNIYIDFICGTSLQGMNGHIGLALFRIIQQQLKLASYCNAEKAEISILEKDGIALYFSMKDMNFADADPQKESFINNIHTRVSMINGEMTLDRSLGDNDVMLINIPREAVA